MTRAPSRLLAATAACATALAFAASAQAAPNPIARLYLRAPASALVPPPSFAAVPAVTLQNLRVGIETNPPQPQFDPAVAASLRNPDVAVTAFEDRNQASVQIARTVDGGRTWTSSEILTAQTTTSTNDPCFTFEPAMAYSRRDDAFYLVIRCNTFVNGLAEVQLFKSVDDGASWTGAFWSSPVFANHSPGQLDIDPTKAVSWMAVAVDNDPASAHYGRIYAGYVLFNSVPPDDVVVSSCPAHVAYSDSVPTLNPRSTHWTDVAVMPPGTSTNASAAADLRLAVDDLGGVDAAFANEDCNSFRDFGIEVARSTTGGASWPTATIITQPSFFGDNPKANDVLQGKGASVFISPSITFDPVGHFIGVTYQNFHDKRRSASDISFQKSADYGSTWTPARPISIGADGKGAPNDQFNAWIAADPTTGYLHAIWLDNRNDPGNRMIETFQGFSADGGATWTNVDISMQPWDPHLGFLGTPSVGTLSGLAAGSNRIYPLWNDARNPGPPGHGGMDVYTNSEPDGSPAQP